MKMNKLILMDKQLRNLVKKYYNDKSLDNKNEVLLYWLDTYLTYSDELYMFDYILERYDMDSLLDKMLEELNKEND